MQSRQRQMKLTADLVDRCHREVPDPGNVSDKYDYFTDEDYTAAVEQLIAAKPPGPVWVFAYGSLIWKPEFHSEERRRVVAQGWQRAFSLRLTRWRATPEQHGYMMCLDEGGTCEGVALRLSDQNLPRQIRDLLVRELGSHEQMDGVRWIDVRDAGGTFKALTFYAAPVLLDYYRANRPLEEVSHALARACGHWGSGAEYLRNTVIGLEEMGFHDPYLWKLQAMVARELQLIQGQ